MHIYGSRDASGCKITSLKMLLTSFLCLLKKKFISNKPSLTFGVEKSSYVTMQRT